MTSMAAFVILLLQCIAFSAASPTMSGDEIEPIVVDAAAVQQTNECVRQGGFCALSQDCPSSGIVQSTKKTCEQSLDGVVCCHDACGRPNPTCADVGGECSDDECHVQPRCSVSGCSKSQTCCIYI